MSQLKTEDGKICSRLLMMAMFIEQNAEWGLQGVRYAFLPSAYKFCRNVSKRMIQEIRLAYTRRGSVGVTALLSEERINDISLVFDELLDADNVDELLELIRQNKKVTVVLNN